MFRKLGDFIYRIPWWALLAGGLAVLVALALFAIPIHVLRLSDHAKTPEERSAIKREINLAFGDRALDIAESVVGTMRARASDPERRRELDRALSEMARARQELSAAKSGTGNSLESAHASAATALESAKDAAESALESATDAREAIEEARSDALTRLREKGFDTKNTARSFDELVRSAREREAAARQSVAALGALRAVEPARAPSVPPLPEVPPASKQSKAPSESAAGDAMLPPAAGEPPATAGKGPDAGAAPPAPSGRAGQITIDLDLPKAGRPDLLPQAVKNDIRAKVAGDVWRVGVGSALILLFIPIFIMLVIAKYFIGRSRRALAFAEEKKQEAIVSDVNRQITEARLQALQAQVEPHFLYNTLANVQALTEADPPAANAMVGHLIQYLRAALPKMRENTSTIGQEIERVAAYLNILKMRMGARLDFGIDVPADLMAQPFPPMMLPSLVENAVKHGLEPVREGGRVDVVARRVTTPGGDRIQLQVRDNGRGLTDNANTSGGGVGLANLRERLVALYGGAGRFTLESNAPRGVVATIDIPAGVPMSSHGTLAGAKSAAASATSASMSVEPPTTGWRRAWQATTRTHSAWAWVASRIFLVLMTLLAVVFLVALISLYTGHMPVDFVGLDMGGLEGIAVGSIVLLAGFAVCALVIAIVVAVFYGLGFLLAMLLILIPVIILVSLFPVLFPFIAIGLAIYFFWWRKKKRQTITPAQAEPRAADDPRAG